MRAFSRASLRCQCLERPKKARKQSSMNDLIIHSDHARAYKRSKEGFKEGKEERRQKTSKAGRIARKKAKREAKGG